MWEPYPDASDVGGIYRTRNTGRDVALGGESDTAVCDVELEMPVGNGRDDGGQNRICKLGLQE